MFKSYLTATANHKTRDLIIDDDFEEEIFFNSGGNLIEDIIYIYSRRKLNVPLNLVLFMRFMSEEYGDGWSIDNQISWYKESIKDFDKYLPEINKYLSLI